MAHRNIYLCVKNGATRNCQYKRLKLRAIAAIRRSEIVRKRVPDRWTSHIARRSNVRAASCIITPAFSEHLLKQNATQYMRRFFLFVQSRPVYTQRATSVQSELTRRKASYDDTARLHARNLEDCGLAGPGRGPSERDSSRCSLCKQR